MTDDNWEGINFRNPGVAQVSGDFIGKPSSNKKHTIPTVSATTETSATIIVLTSSGPMQAPCSNPSLIHFSNVKELSDLSDITAAVSSPSEGDILVFRGASSGFTLETKPTGSGTDVSTISQLGDVSTAGVTDLELLVYVNADSEWQPRTATELGIETSAGGIKTAYESNSDTNAFTDAEKTKLSGIETNATADQTDSEIETAYHNQVSVVSQAEAEAGTATTTRRWTAQRVKQAIDALSTGAEVPNLLINGDFRVAQRGATFVSGANDDGDYTLDRWKLLTDGNDIFDVSRNTASAPDGAYACLEMECGTANKKGGILQILEARDAAVIIDGTVSLSFVAARAAGNTTIETLRAAILSWSGAADAPTSDPVSAWNAAGSDPTLVANWTYENTPSDLTLTDTFQTFTVENVSIDTASAKNVAVFIWVDDADGTVADQVRIANVRLEEGSSATTHVPLSFSEELAKCQRFYWQGYAPGGGASRYYATASLTFMLANNVAFPVRMRAVPSIAIVTAATYVNCSHSSFAARVDGFQESVTKDATSGIYEAKLGVYSADAEL